MLQLIFKKWNGSMDCIAFTQNRDRQGVLVNVVIKLCIPYNVGILGEFLDYLRTSQFFRKDAAPWI
jgi:hypothetical protein